MKNFEKSEFLDESAGSMEVILNLLNDLPAAGLCNLDPQKTALVIIDMVNGFARQGMLKSDRIEKLIPGIAELAEKCNSKGIPILNFTDSHTQNCSEFEAYPPHCIRGTAESEVVDELKAVGGYTLILKNSTNCFLEDDFQSWLKNNPGITNFIITGDCTDICILQFALTLKGYYNMKDISTEIIVPVDDVDTYDIPPHSGDLMNVFALYSMMCNGIRVVRTIND